MNRVASRSLMVLVMVLALLAGTVAFVVEYSLKAPQWVMSPGSPHVYDGKNRISQGTVTDAQGKVILKLGQSWTYSKNALVRRSFVHWVGDRQSNIPSRFLSAYEDKLVPYDPVAGTYHYGEAAGTLALTLDAELQAVALEALGDRVGTLALYNYETGELLCAVTTPTFDPDSVPEEAREGLYLNRFLRGWYTPGSIFKTVTLAAALECIPDIRERTFTCTGSFEIQGGDVTCEQAHGKQTLKQAFCNSCNCAFAQLVREVGRERMTAFVEQFGLTEAISGDGVRTAAGGYDVTDATAEEFCWSGVGQYTDAVNPCTFLRFVGAIANGGVLMEPYAVGSVTVGGKTAYTAQPRTAGRILSPETAEVLREYMGNNVQSKYGADNFPGLTVCAKSGTGEVGDSKRPNAMFTGFLADEDLPVAFIVCVEDGGYGAPTCVPILAPVLECLRDMAR